jgi:hypothetical protein
MTRHNIPTSFAGISVILHDLFSRLESLERRPRTGIERVTVLADATLDPVTRYVWIDATAPALNVTLPDPWDGATVSIKNLSSSDTTVFPPFGTINGSATVLVPGGLATLSHFQSDGVNWITL